MPPRDDGWRFVVMTEPRGKAYVALKPRGSNHAKLALSKASDAFELEVARIASMVLPVLPPDAMVGIRVESVKQRPRDRIGERTSRIYCPVKPDAANVLKCVEDALMRCRVCSQRRPDCGRTGAHRFAPTLVDDSRIVDDGCRTWYSAVDRIGPNKKTWRSRPSRVEVHVWLVDN